MFKLYVQFCVSSCYLYHSRKMRKSGCKTFIEQLFHYTRSQLELYVLPWKILLKSNWKTKIATVKNERATQTEDIMPLHSWRGGNFTWDVGNLQDESKRIC